MGVLRFQHIIWIIFILCKFPATNGLQFILERQTLCPTDTKAFKFQYLNYTIVKNKVKAQAEIDVTENLLEMDGVLDIQVKSCPTDKSCGVAMPIQIKEVCKFLSAKSVFGSRFGDQFTPAIRCPVKPGHYVLNATANLKSITRFPGSKTRSIARLAFLENLQNNRKRTVVCVEATVNGKE